MADFEEILKLFLELKVERDRERVLALFRGYLKGLIQKEQESGA